jgi:hypothetical protein
MTQPIVPTHLIFGARRIALRHAGVTIAREAGAADRLAAPFRRRPGLDRDLRSPEDDAAHHDAQPVDLGRHDLTAGAADLRPHPVHELLRILVRAGAEAAIALDRDDSDLFLVRPWMAAHRAQLAARSSRTSAAPVDCRPDETPVRRSRSAQRSRGTSRRAHGRSESSSSSSSLRPGVPNTTVLSWSGEHVRMGLRLLFGDKSGSAVAKWQ